MDHTLQPVHNTIRRIGAILLGQNMSKGECVQYISVYLLVRHMTKSIVKELDVPEKFSWEALVDYGRNNSEEDALVYFYNKNTDCFMNHFCRVFVEGPPSFNIQNPKIHKQIIELLTDIHIDDKFDIIAYTFITNLLVATIMSE